MKNYSKRSTSHFLETIRLMDGYLDLLPLHQARMNKVRRLCMGESVPISLASHFSTLALPKTGLHKVRVIYGRTIEKVEVSPYDLIPIKRLRLVDSTSKTYGIKWEDRAWINAIASQYPPGEVPLFHRRGRILETNYCNVAFHLNDVWHTPMYPMFYGARRRALIEEGVITERDIFIEQMCDYTSVRLFNAMIPFEEAIELDAVCVRIN